MLLSLPGTMGCGKWFLMASSEAGSALARVWQGHALLAACAALYLVWWVLFFRPEGSKPAGALYAFGVACIMGAVACGLAGVSLARYVLYYRLGPAASFVDGMVPLVAVGVESVVLVALLLR